MWKRQQYTFSVFPQSCVSFSVLCYNIACKGVYHPFFLQNITLVTILIQSCSLQSHYSGNSILGTLVRHMHSRGCEIRPKDLPHQEQLLGSDGMSHAYISLRYRAISCTFVTPYFKLAGPLWILEVAYVIYRILFQWIYQVTQKSLGKKTDLQHF